MKRTGHYAVLPLILILGLVTGCCTCLKPAGGELFGLRNPGDGGRQLISLDPATGAITPISASISPPLPGSSGVVALDGPGNRFFFVGTVSGETDARLFTVDTTTGAVLHNPVLLGSASAFINALEYDDVNGVLFALRNPGGGGRQLVSLDPATGAVTTISAAISPPLPSASGVSALDAAGRRFFFVATPSGETDSRLFTVDTASGAVLGNPVLVGSSSAFINGMAYDGVHGVLFGVRNPGGGGRQLVSLDPVTGTVTAISGNISPPLPSASGVCALDATGRRFFFVATPTGETDSRLYTVDTQTGAVLHNPVLLGSAAAFIEGLAFFAAAPPVIQAAIGN